MQCRSNWALMYFADFIALLIRRWPTLSYCISVDATLMRGLREHVKDILPQRLRFLRFLLEKWFSLRIDWYQERVPRERSRLQKTANKSDSKINKDGLIGCDVTTYEGASVCAACTRNGIYYAKISHILRQLPSRYVIPDAFVALGRKPMTPPKVDVSAARGKHLPRE